MKRFLKYTIAAAVIVAGLYAPTAAQAITVTIDGVTSPTVLSDAVDTCMSAGPGPHTINITTDTLSTPDRQVVITQAITINGDADNNQVPCDILVDMQGIRDAADVGVLAYKSYIEIQAAGAVTLNDVNIHPNANGAYANFSNSPVQNVSGIRVFRPVLDSETGIYNFNNVGVSGSASDDTYLSLGTSEDLFAGTKRWGGLGGDGANEVNHVKHAALVFAEDSAVPSAGAIVSTLDHCEMGLSRGCALSINTTNTTVQILGGIFGHCARDGIRIADGANVTIKGTATDRVRVVRSTNISGGNAHSIEVVGGAVVPLIEYTDVAGENTANGIAFRDGVVSEVNYFRSLGKFQETDPTNHALFMGSSNISVGLVRNSTIHGHGSPTGDPLGVQASVVNPVNFLDTIFTSEYTTETIFIGTTTGTVTFQNCALTSDGLAGESMADPAITGEGFTSGLGVVIEDCIYTSPQYLLTLEDYDWSDAQGALDPLNGPGNRNVLRPALTNLAYATASSTGGRLTGGAGPELAGIDDWMLME